MQAKRQIVIRADPVGGIQSAGLQRGENLGTRHVDGADTDAVHRFTCEAWQA